MPHRVYAMDTFFYHSLGAYEFDVRCEMLAELKYDATYLTLWSEAAWQDLPRLRDVKRKFGLDVAATYVSLDLDDAAGTSKLDVEKLLQTIEGCNQIELAITASGKSVKPSDPSADDCVLKLLERLLRIAETRDLKIFLYPHINHWLERTSDALRLCQRISHPRLGAMFCGFHWYAVDRCDVFSLLETATPFLRQVNLCGSRLDPDGLANKATIETIDEGELDNFAILGALRRIGYDGMIGLQGYSIGGDVYSKLQRSIIAFRDMESRLARHPQWAMLRK
jgi:sugar phosphate isomerase/epimerase